MGYNDLTDRTAAAPLIPEEVYGQILQDLPSYSTAMQLMKRLPNMTTGQLRLPVSTSLVSAYWRNPTDTGLGQTTSKAWQNVYVYAEELVAIAPIPRNVLEDAEPGLNLWDSIKVDAMTAMGSVFDQSVFYGTNAPASFPDDIMTVCTAAGHVVSLADYTDAYDALLSENGLLSLIEQDGFMPDAHVAALSMKSKLRGVRGADGSPIFAPSPADGVRQYTLDGERILFPTNGAVNPATSLMLSGQWDQAVWSIRRDFEFALSTDGVIVNAQKEVEYALRQQGLVALYCTMRIGWARPNPINRIDSNAVTRCPFGVLTA